MWKCLQTSTNVKKEIALVKDEIPMLEIKWVGEYGYMQERMNIQALDAHLKELQDWRELLASATLKMATSSNT